jgi:battenin
MVVAFIIIAMATLYPLYEVAFYFALISAVMHGISSSLGGCTILGFCKGFPSEVVGYYGSGTGFAGIFGSGIFLILKGLANLNDGIIFFCVLPSVLVYLLSFYWLNHKKA